MPYYELSITIPGVFRDILIRKLNDLGCLGSIEERNRVLAYFPASLDSKALDTEILIMRSLFEASARGGQFTVKRTLIPDQDWNAVWKKDFHAIDIGSRFTILPPWEEEKEGRINIIIDPAMAFGTGHHETTRSCLSLMEKYAVQSGRKYFLDIGTGTGILAVAAAKMGFRHVMGVDTDPLAVEAAQINSTINHTPDIRFRKGEPADLEEQYDFIVANIISGTLVALAPSIAARLEQSGFCVLSGILQGQEQEVIEAVHREHLVLIEVYPDGKWTSLVVRNQAGTKSS